MDIMTVANLIENKIKTLEKGRGLLQDRAKKKAETIAEYDKSIAKVCLQLKAGVKFKLDDYIIENPSAANIIEKAAKGICWKERLAMDLAESEYKNAIEGLRCIEAELNGYQSINRYLSEK